MKKISFLLAGESWISSSTHFKGWDYFSSTVYETGIEYFERVFQDSDIEFHYMPSHIASREFPLTIEELQKYDVICLSDIGANTLLLHPDTWLSGKAVPNRLDLLVEWVKSGGGLCMCGGYLSFAGIYGSAKYYRTQIEKILPVDIYPFDDRLEMPEGSLPEIVDPAHPIIVDLGDNWPHLLGINELILKPEANLIAEINGLPLLSTMIVEQGRTLIWASDIGPHWCPNEFLKWSGYRKLWTNAVKWLANEL